MTEETITISLKRYEGLLDAEKILDALYAAGVDNWEGYRLALEGIDGDEESYEEIYGEEK